MWFSSPQTGRTTLTPATSAAVPAVASSLLERRPVRRKNRVSPRSPSAVCEAPAEFRQRLAAIAMLPIWVMLAATQYAPTAQIAIVMSLLSHVGRDIDVTSDVAAVTPAQHDAARRSGVMIRNGIPAG